MTRVLDQAAGHWGSVALARSVVSVRAVASGAEPDLAHFLEGVVLQVNADLGLTPPERDGDSSLQRRRAADRAMAAAFRAFAGDAG